MEAKIDSDGSPLCPDCNTALDHEESQGRDRETMGGYSIEYFRCEKCKTQWEVIDKYTEKSIYPTSCN